MAPEDEAAEAQSHTSRRGVRLYLGLLALGFCLMVARSVDPIVTRTWLAIVGVATAALWVLTWHRAPAGRVLLWPALALSGAAVFFAHSSARHANAYELSIGADLEWLNENLSDDDVVLLVDGRLTPLRRSYLAIDDIRLEPFDREQSPNAAIVERRRLGITHFYFSHASERLLSDSMRRKRFLIPAPRNTFVELVHRSCTGWVVEFR